jgi:hypothetical protein
VCGGIVENDRCGSTDIVGVDEGKTVAPALSHQPFLLLITWVPAGLEFNKVNALASRQQAAREPFLVRCDGVDGARAASGSMKSCAKMVVVRATV